MTDRELLNRVLGQIADTEKTLVEIDEHIKISKEVVAKSAAMKAKTQRTRFELAELRDQIRRRLS